MKKPTSPLTKACAVCGIQKPISAFLQLSESEGATYGNVCSSCRHDQKDKSKLQLDIEEGSSTHTGMTIDAKARVKGETDKRELHQQVEEEYHAERDKDEVEEGRQTNKSEQVRQKERDHRESFLTRRITTGLEKKGDTERALESRKQTQRVALDAQGAEKTAQLEKVTQEEEKEKGVDFSVPFIDTQIAGKVKHTQNPFLKLFLERERGLAMNRIFGIKVEAAPQTSAKPTIEKPSEKPSTKPEERAEIETPSQDAEKKWGPRSR